MREQTLQKMKTCRSRAGAIAAACLLSWNLPIALPALAGEEVIAHSGPGNAGLAERLSHLTLDDAINLALHRNPDILRQLQEIQRSQGVVVQVFSAVLPQLVVAGTFSQDDRSLSQSGSRGGSSSGGGVSGIPLLQPANPALAPVDLNSILNSLLGSTTTTGGTGTGSSTGSTVSSFSSPDRNYSITLEIQQTLYNAAIPPQIRQARFLRNAEYYTLRETVDTTVNTVKTEFYTVLVNQALVTINEENLHLLESQLKDQQNRFAAGTVPRFDVLQASVAVANQRPLVIAAINNVNLAFVALARTLGVAYGSVEQKTMPIKLIGNLDYHPQEFSPDAGIAAAKANRALLKQQRLNILSEVEAIRIAAAGYQPTLSATAGLEQRNSSLQNDLGAAVNGWFYGANFNWNVFDGFATYGRVKQARALLAEAKVAYDDSVRQVVEDVETNYLNLQQYKQTIQSQVLTVSEAEEAVRLAQARLSAGAGTQLDVLQSQVALIQAQTTELQARYNYAVALANYERVTATSTVYPETFDDPMVRKERATGQPAVATGITAPGKKLKPDTVKTPDEGKLGNGQPVRDKIDADRPDMPLHPHKVADPDEPPIQVQHP
jgi:outer membrane protein TolC